MDIIKYIARVEGCELPTNTFLCFGKKLESTGTHNGWYVMLRCQFITKLIPDFLSPVTFTHAPTKCYWTWSWSTRKSPAGSLNSVMWHGCHWIPLTLLGK